MRREPDFGRTIFRAVLAGVLAAVALSGCTQLEESRDLQARLIDEGYSEVSVHHGSSRVNDFSGGSRTYDLLTVRVEHPDAKYPPNDTDYDALAEIVWTTYGPPFGALEMEINSAPATLFERSDLHQKFGPQDPAIRQRPGDSGPMVLAAVGISFAIIVVVAVVVLVVALRARRRPLSAEQAPAGTPPPFAGIDFDDRPPD